MLFSSCTKSPSEKKSDETIFLENLMIREGGLFVLMGSKPMVWFELGESSGCSWSKEMERIWPVWKAHLNEYVGPCYAIREDFIHKGHSAYFANIPNTLALLNTHYSEFKRLYGKEFDPIEMIHEFQNNNPSDFWDAVFQNHYLQGLLFGYGPRNSAGFLWIQENNLTLPPLQIFTFERSDCNYFKPEVTVTDLPLPSLALYGVHDSYLEKYRSERIAIFKKFKNKDFVTVTNEWLKRGAYKDPKWLSEPLSIEWE